MDDVTKLVERLNKAAMDCAGSDLEETVPICLLLSQAADTITRLCERVEELEAQVASLEDAYTYDYYDT